MPVLDEKPPDRGAPDAPCSPALMAAVDAFGQFFERFGLRRNVGRTWAMLYLAPRPLDQAALGELLDLSAGLVSGALTELLHWGAVRARTVPGERRTFYEAEDRLLRIVANILARRDLCAVRDLREAMARARTECQPAGFTRLLRRRLRAVEALTELYEALAGLVIRASTVSDAAVGPLVRLLRGARLDDAAPREP